jgi:hypothetical protein
MLTIRKLRRKLGDNINEEVNEMRNPDTLLDIEKNLRNYEGALACGFRHYDCVHDEDYFLLMEELGFLVNNRFIPIIDILISAARFSVQHEIFALEAVAADLSKWSVRP